MFFFFHLVTGIILGLLIGDLLNDRRWIVPCIIGAALPDLVDKPLYILFPAIFGNGRFLFHILIVFAILLVAGFLLWKYYASPVILALDIGIFSHQILDSMWMYPKMWLYPLLGGPYPAQTLSPQDFLLYILENDIYNPAEWVIIIICVCGLALFWLREPLAAAAARHKKAVGTLLKSLEIVLWVLCGIVLACGLLKIPLQDLAVKSADQYAFTIVIIALAAILIVRWETVLKNARPVPEKRQTAHVRPYPAGPAVREIERMEYLVRLAGKDPDQTTLAAAKEIAATYGSYRNRKNDPPPT